MALRLLADFHLEFLSLKGGCTGLSESIHVKIPHFWRSHVAADFVFTKLLVFLSIFTFHVVRKMYQIKLSL